MKKQFVRAVVQAAGLGALAAAFAATDQPWAAVAAALGCGYVARVAWVAFEALPEDRPVRRR